MLHNEQSLQQLILYVMIKITPFFRLLFVNFLIGNLFQDENVISLLFHIWFSKKNLNKCHVRQK